MSAKTSNWRLLRTKRESGHIRIWSESCVAHLQCRCRSNLTQADYKHRIWAIITLSRQFQVHVKTINICARVFSYVFANMRKAGDTRCMIQNWRINGVQITKQSKLFYFIPLSNISIIIQLHKQFLSSLPCRGHIFNQLYFGPWSIASTYRALLVRYLPSCAKFSLLWN